MTTSKSDINDSYKQALRKLVDAEETLKEFIDLSEMAEMDGWVRLKIKAQALEQTVYNPIRVFLQDYSMTVSSSDVQTAIDELEDDVCENCGGTGVSPADDGNGTMLCEICGGED